MPRLHPVLTGDYNIQRYQHNNASINSQLCLKPDRVCTTPESRTNRHALPNDWLKRLAQILFENSPYYNGQYTDKKKNNEINNIHNTLKQHAGADSRYPGRGNLNNELQRLYSYLIDRDISQGQSNDSKRLISHQLTEDLDSCSQGFHSRVNNILQKLNEPQNMDDVLAKLRHDLVRFAIGRIDPNANVHDYNMAFCVAYEMGLGVDPINPDDHYLGALDIDTVQSQLKEVFDDYWQPLPIFKMAFDSIQDQLRNIEDTNGVGQSNTFAVYGKQVEFLDKLFKTEDEQESSFNKYLITDHYSNVTGLNRSAIATTLWRHLNGYRYFNLDQNIDSFMERLLKGHNMTAGEMPVLQRLVSTEQDINALYWLYRLIDMPLHTRLNLIALRQNENARHQLELLKDFINRGAQNDKHFEHTFTALLGQLLTAGSGQLSIELEILWDELDRQAASVKADILQSTDHDGRTVAKAALNSDDKVCARLLKTMSQLNADSQASILLTPASDQDRILLDRALTIESNTCQSLLKSIIYNGLTTGSRDELLTHETRPGQSFIVDGLVKNASGDRHPIVRYINDLQASDDIVHVLTLRDNQGCNICNQLLKSQYLNAVEPLIDAYLRLEPQDQQTVLTQSMPDGSHQLDNIVEYFAQIKQQGVIKNFQVHYKLLQVIAGLRAMSPEAVASLLLSANAANQKDLLFEASKTNHDAFFSMLVYALSAVDEQRRVTYLNQAYGVGQAGLSLVDVIKRARDIKPLMGLIYSFSDVLRHDFTSQLTNDDYDVCLNYWINIAIRANDSQALQSFLRELTAFGNKRQFNIVTGNVGGLHPSLRLEHLLKLAACERAFDVMRALVGYIAHNWHNDDIVRLFEQSVDGQKLSDYIPDEHRLDDLQPLLSSLLQADNLALLADHRLMDKLKHTDVLQQEVTKYLDKLKARDSGEIKYILGQHGNNGQPFVFDLIENSIKPIEYFVDVFKALSVDDRMDILQNWRAHDGATLMTRYMAAYRQWCEVTIVGSVNVRPFLEWLTILDSIPAHQLNPVLRNQAQGRGSLLMDAIGLFKPVPHSLAQPLFDRLMDHVACKSDYEMIIRLLTDQDDAGNNLLMMAAQNRVHLKKVFHLFEKLSGNNPGDGKLKALFEATNNQQQNVFMLAGYYATKRDLKGLWSHYSSLDGVTSNDIVNALTQKDAHGENFLHYIKSLKHGAQRIRQMRLPDSVLQDLLNSSVGEQKIGAFLDVLSYTSDENVARILCQTDCLGYAQNCTTIAPLIRLIQRCDNSPRLDNRIKQGLFDNYDPVLKSVHPNMIGLFLRNRPDSTHELRALLDELSLERQAIMFGMVNRQTDSTSLTVISELLFYHSMERQNELFPLFMNAIENMDYTAQRTILLSPLVEYLGGNRVISHQYLKYGEESVVSLVLQYRPDLFQQCARLIEAMPKQFQYEILTQVDSEIDSKTMLNIALKRDVPVDQWQRLLTIVRQADHTRSVLENTMLKLDVNFSYGDEQTQHLYTKLTQYLLTEQPAKFPAWLDYLSTLVYQEQVCILASDPAPISANAHPDSMLEHVVNYAPDNCLHPVLTVLKDVVSHLTPQDCLAMPSRLITSMNNALIVAVQSRPEAISPLLDFIDCFTYEQKPSLFLQDRFDTFQGQWSQSNPLIVVLQHHPQYTERVLDSIEKLDDRSRYQLIEGDDGYGRTAWSQCSTSRPDLLARLMSLAGLGVDHGQDQFGTVQANPDNGQSCQNPDQGMLVLNDGTNRYATFGNQQHNSLHDHSGFTQLLLDEPTFIQSSDDNNDHNVNYQSGLFTSTASEDSGQYPQSGFKRPHPEDYDEACLSANKFRKFR